MCVQNSIRRIALSEASNSTADHFKVAAVIHKGKKVYCKAVNIPRRTHTLGSGSLQTCHAEVRVIVRAKSILNGDLSGLSIFVARINQFGEVKPSKPCNDCWKLIQESGLKALWT